MRALMEVNSIMIVSALGGARGILTRRPRCALCDAPVAGFAQFAPVQKCRGQ
jgi:hypothetical protein